MPTFEETELYKLITTNQQSHETWETALKLIQSDPMTARLVQPETGDTFLHVLVRTVAQEGWLGTCTEPLVFALSNAGTDVNAINKEGDTALHTLLKGLQLLLISKKNAINLICFRLTVYDTIKKHGNN